MFSSSLASTLYDRDCLYDTMFMDVYEVAT